VTLVGEITTNYSLPGLS